ncbi:MAG: hypothetical protein ACFFHD_15485, partial [Promethearchaeota archaeon]
LSYRSITDPQNIYSFWTSIGMILVDVFIILYSVSTLMGSQAEMLSKRLKRIGIDTVIIWLVFSKVAYEFIQYFPYPLLSDLQIPFSDIIPLLNEDWINLTRNIAIFAFFLLLLILLGLYEIRKYVINQKKLKEEVRVEVKELLFPEPIIEEIKKEEEGEVKDVKEDTEDFEEFYEYKEIKD